MSGDKMMVGQAIVPLRNVDEARENASSDKAHEFSAGDLVKLKSGGPKMTVGWADKIHVECQWFDGSNTSEHNLKSVKLLPAQLLKCEE